MSFETKVRNFCLSLGILQVALIGFGTIGINLQATIFYLTTLSVLLFVARGRAVAFHAYHYALLFFSVALALFFSVTTNGLVVGVTNITTAFLLSLFVLFLFERHMPEGPLAYARSVLRFLQYSIVDGLSMASVKRFFAFNIKHPHVKVKRDSVLGLFFAIPILALFHILFARVNSEYAFFMDQIIDQIWRFIRYIIDIEILWIMLKGALQGYLWYVMFTVQHTKKEDAVLAKHASLAAMKVMLILVVVLFSIFSSFQSRLLLMDIFHLAFVEISQYVQKGFLELLVVTCFGYLLSLVALHRLPHESSSDRTHTRWLLGIFALELLGITIFMAHKLYALQAVFGFKDQRILADGAIALIFTTFLFLFFRIIHKISAASIFRIQILLLSGFVLLLHVINVDVFISRYNSIRYVAEERQQKDYSYLLGNSYDNVSEWERIMGEAQDVGIPTPDMKYYWGFASRSKKDFFGSSYDPICTRVQLANVYTDIERDYSPEKKFSYESYLLERYNSILKKYNTLKNTSVSLTTWTAVNFHEYEAYQFLQKNSAMVDTFLEFAKSRCVDDVNN